MVREKLLKMLAERNIKPSVFAAKIGIKTSTLDDLLKGKTSEYNMGVDKIIKICKGLGISVEDLYGLQKPRLSDNEAILLRNYHFLNAEGQEKLMGYLDDLLSSGRYQDKNCELNMVSSEEA